MKFLPLLFANLTRRKIRTTLTLGSFAVALFLFGLLVTIHYSFKSGVEAAGADRFVILNKVTLIEPLPVAYRDRIARIPGVQDLTYANWFGGVYRDEKNFFPQFAIDHENWLKIYPEFLVPPKQWQAFLQDKQGAIVGKATAERFGWKIGDRIPIKGAIFVGDWEFNLVGIYTGKRPSDDLTQFWFRWDYLMERADPQFKNLAGWYVGRHAPGTDRAAVFRAIDGAFANSTHETRTQTEQAFMAGFIEQMGNIKFLLTAVGAIVFFTLLLVTGNTMAISVRERTGELAVLKTIGFTDRSVLGLVLTESLLISALGGGFGIALAKAFTLGGDPTHGMFAAFFMPDAAVAVGVALALAVGVAAGILPALAAMNLRVVDALRRL